MGDGPFGDCRLHSASLTRCLKPPFSKLETALHIQATSNETKQGAWLATVAAVRAKPSRYSLSMSLMRFR